MLLNNTRCSKSTVSGALTRGHDFDAHIPAVVLNDDAAPARLVLQPQHAGAAGQEVARVVKGVEANQVCGRRGEQGGWG